LIKNQKNICSKNAFDKYKDNSSKAKFKNIFFSTDKNRGISNHFHFFLRSLLSINGLQGGMFRHAKKLNVRFVNK